MRKYPVGIQSFESIRTDGYVYVDKTSLVYKMITEGKPYFLSRPRHFGKSLLVNTLAAVFEGRRELFEAFTTKQGIEQPQLFIATTDPSPKERGVYSSAAKKSDGKGNYSPLLGRGVGGEANMLYTLFVSFGADVVAEDLSSKGRADLTLKMPKGIYILELKYDDTADNALRQIEERGYASKYALERQRVGDGTSGIGRPIVKVGLAFSSKERNIMEWKSE